MQYIIGIDPGLTGAIALLAEDGTLIGTHDMPVMANGLATGSVKTKVNAAALAHLLLQSMNLYGPVDAVYMEEPDPMPARENKHGKRVGMPAASAKSMGRSIGVVEGVCAASRITVYLLKPADWKKALGLPRDKEVCRSRAIEWYPSADLARKKDHNRAEAILIARYGWERTRRIPG